MKQIGLYLLFCIAIILSSCKDNRDLATLIPENVPCVARIDLKSILSKADVIENGNYKLSSSIKAIIDNNDSALICQLLKYGKATGIDVNENLYFYIPQKGFQICFLMKIEDKESFETFIMHLTGENMSQIKDDIKVVMKDGLVIATKENLSLFAIADNKTKKEDLNNLASVLIDFNGVSIISDETIKQKLSEDKDITFYMNMSNANNMLRHNDLTKQFIKDFPIIRLLTDSDIKNVFGQMHFNENQGDMKIEVNCDSNGEFSKFYNTILSQPSNKFLKIIPSNADGIASFSVNGTNLININEIKSMANKINAMPFMSRLDIISMLNNISGSISIAYTQDSNFEDEYNYVIVAESNNPHEIIRIIKTYASSIGQEPEISNGEYVYAYYNRQIKVGEQDDLVYAKILNYEQDSESCESIAEANRFFSKMNLGVLIKFKNQAIFDIGLNSATSGNGKFVVAPNENATAKFLELLCLIPPTNNKFGQSDYGDFVPLEEINF